MITINIKSNFTAQIKPLSKETNLYERTNLP